MKVTKRKVKLAWKYRRALWKYRNVIRHRKEIAGVVLAGAAIAAGVILRRQLRQAS